MTFAELAEVWYPQAKAIFGRIQQESRMGTLLAIRDAFRGR
jgi:hypothetical protein